jgi:hypothetical protein
MKTVFTPKLEATITTATASTTSMRIRETVSAVTLLLGHLDRRIGSPFWERPTRRLDRGCLDGTGRRLRVDARAGQPAAPHPELAMLLSWPLSRFCMCRPRPVKVRLEYIFTDGVQAVRALATTAARVPLQASVSRDFDDVSTKLPATRLLVRRPLACRSRGRLANSGSRPPGRRVPCWASASW